MFTNIVSTLAIAISCGVAFAGEASDENQTWIVISPDSVIVASNRAEARKLIDGHKKQHLLVACSELQFQIEGTTADGKPKMKLQCKNVTVTTENIRKDAMQSNVTAESMTYESASQLLELTGNVIVRSESFQGTIQAGSMHLNLNDSSIRLEATGADVRLESLPYPLQTQKRDTDGKANALFFSASWCGPCQTMQPIVAKLKSAGHRIEIIDVDREPKAVKQYGVQSIPQFIVLDGKTVRDRVVGVQSLDELKQLLRADRSRPAPPPLPEPADAGPVSAMKPISIIACPPAVRSTEISITPNPIMSGVVRGVVRQSFNGDGVGIFVPDTLGEPAVRLECDACTIPDRKAFGAYQPLIPELLDPPPEKETPKRSFRFDDYYLTR